MFFFCPENAVKDDARVKRATGLCKQIVGVFSHSWKKKTALKKAQQELNLPEHSLITECPTRLGLKAKNDWEGVGAEQGVVSGSV